MSNFIDLVAVTRDPFYAEKTDIFEAPYCKLSVGDEVETEFGRGTVVDIVNVWRESNLYNFITRHSNFHRVKSIIEPLNYEEDENV